MGEGKKEKFVISRHMKILKIIISQIHVPNQHRSNEKSGKFQNSKFFFQFFYKNNFLQEFVENQN